MRSDNLLPQKRLIGSLCILGASLTLSLVVYFGLWGDWAIEVVSRWTANWSSSALNLIGFSTIADGTIIASSTFSVNIVAECTALGPIILFIGAVFAIPASLKNKVIGILLGTITLSIVNILRIVSLFWIGSQFPRHLEFSHLLIWQGLMIVLAIVLWLYWSEYIVKAKNA